jgi:hypothetical protein
MPYQVSWQSVSIKSQRPVHVLGAEAKAVVEALVGVVSAAHAPLAVAAAAARIVAARVPSLSVVAPLCSYNHRDTEKDNYKTQSAPTQQGRKIPMLVAARPQPSRAIKSADRARHSAIGGTETCSGGGGSISQAPFWRRALAAELTLLPCS